MILTFELEDYLKKLNIDLPSSDEFNKLVDNLSYFQADTTNEILNLNYERGILLYCLIKKFGPKNILEFGTAKGFGTLMIAWGLNDINTDGEIFTIDLVNHDEKITHCYKQSGKILSKITTRNELWGIVPPTWLKKIKILSGYSSEIISKNKLPKIQFFYIDGAHFYDGVKHDFLSSLLLSDSKSYFLFDDYVERAEYGVKDLIDNEISPYFDVHLIKTDKSNYLINKGITKKEYGMCFCEIERDVMINAFGIKKIEEFITKYRIWEKRYKLRNKINQKIPFLKKIRFSEFLK